MITVPSEYRWYIREYGSGGIAGVDILGAAFNGALKCVRETERFRKLGLPKDTIVFYSAGEYVYYLDCKNSTGESAPVNRWDASSMEYIRMYDSFFDCVYDLFNEELDNLEL